MNFASGQNVTNASSTAVEGFSTAGGAFSARFTGSFKPTITGEQVFKVRTDGRYRYPIACTELPRNDINQIVRRL